MIDQLDLDPRPCLILNHGEPVEYRCVTSADLRQLHKLEIDVFAADGWDAATLRHFLGCRTSRWLVATIGDEIIGYCMYLEEAGNTVHIGNLAVVEAYRRKGIGKALLAWMLREAAKLPANRVYLEVAVESFAARALYQAAGFEASKKLSGHYANSDGIEMVLTER